MTCTVYQLIIMTLAINGNAYWHKSHSMSQCKLISLVYITRMTTYSDEKEPKRRERERERNEEGDRKEKKEKIIKNELRIKRK